MSDIKFDANDAEWQRESLTGWGYDTSQMSDDQVLQLFLKESRDRMNRLASTAKEAGTSFLFLSRAAQQLARVCQTK